MTNPHRRTVYPRQHDYDSVYKFIVAYKSAHDGNSPSIRQIMDEFNIGSTSLVTYILDRLEGSGLISVPVSHTGRRLTCAIEVVGGCWLAPDTVKAPARKGTK